MTSRGHFHRVYYAVSLLTHITHEPWLPFRKTMWTLSKSRQHASKILRYSSRRALSVFAALVLIDVFKLPANPTAASGVVTATVCLCKSLHLPDQLHLYLVLSPSCQVNINWAWKSLASVKLGMFGVYLGLLYLTLHIIWTHNVNYH